MTLSELDVALQCPNSVYNTLISRVKRLPRDGWIANANPHITALIMNNHEFVLMKGKSPKYCLRCLLSKSDGVNIALNRFNLSIQ